MEAISSVRVPVHVKKVIVERLATPLSLAVDAEHVLIVYIENKKKL